jgi:hypothetical protein
VRLLDWLIRLYLYVVGWIVIFLAVLLVMEFLMGDIR